MIILSFGNDVVQPGAVGESRTSGRKTEERHKPREEKSGSVALRPVEDIPPLYRIWRIEHEQKMI